MIVPGANLRVMEIERKRRGAGVRVFGAMGYQTGAQKGLFNCCPGCGGSGSVGHRVVGKDCFVLIGLALWGMPWSAPLGAVRNSVMRQAWGLGAAG